jgi:glycosyltransferase involved in cell wall biosynthesis
VTPPVTILCATFNSRDAVRLTFTSLERHTLEPHVVLVADNGSTDGTLHDLRALPWPALDVVELDSDHGGALDYLVARVETTYFVTLDSDVEFVEAGWLTALLDLACRENLDALGVFEPALGNYRARLAPHLCLLRTETFRRLKTSFREFASFTDQAESARFRARDRSSPLTVEEVATYRAGRFYPTGALVFERLQQHGARWSDLPQELCRMFQHLGHMSWNASEDKHRYVRDRLAELSRAPGSPTALAEPA